MPPETFTSRAGSTASPGGSAAPARLAGLVPAERATIAAYLAHRAEVDDFAHDDIEQSLANYWLDGSG